MSAKEATATATAPAEQPAVSAMPKKKDPRLRAAQQSQTQKQFFDSADYETQKQKAQSDPKLVAQLKAKAAQSPHLTR